MFLIWHALLSPPPTSSLHLSLPLSIPPSHSHTLNGCVQLKLHRDIALFVYRAIPFYLFPSLSLSHYLLDRSKSPVRPRSGRTLNPLWRTRRLVQWIQWLSLIRVTIASQSSHHHHHWNSFLESVNSFYCCSLLIRCSICANSVQVCACTYYFYILC